MPRLLSGNKTIGSFNLKKPRISVPPKVLPPSSFDTGTLVPSMLKGAYLNRYTFSLLDIEEKVYLLKSLHFICSYIIVVLEECNLPNLHLSLLYLPTDGTIFCTYVTF